MTDLPPSAPGCESCAARDAVIEEQAVAIAELREKVARLERLMSRNSGNSSMPPSSDDVPGRVPPSRQQRRAAERAAARRRGKQPGSPGAAMSWAVPDRIVPVLPAGACECGENLAGAADLGVARSLQQLELPAAAAERVQHDLHRIRCGCGREHVAARPPGVPDSAVSIGPRLRALAVYLVIYQHVPVERCRELIADVTGAAVSAGFIHSCLARAARSAAGPVAAIRNLIRAAAVAGFDETTLRAGPAGTRKYVLGAFTERVGAGNSVTAFDLVFPPGPEWSNWASGSAATVTAAAWILMSLRIAYLAVLQVFGWLALLARSDSAKDAEIRAPRTQLEVAM